MRKVNERLDEGKSCARHWWRNHHRIGALALLFLTGCSTIKNAAIVSSAGLATAGVSSALGLATVPTALATGAAVFAAKVYVEAATPRSSLTTEGVSTMSNNCAPDNFWTALGTVVEMGGIYLILAFVVVPLLVGWMAPGPLERKKKK